MKFVENVTKIKKSSDSGQNQTSMGENIVWNKLHWLQA